MNPFLVFLICFKCFAVDNFFSRNNSQYVFFIDFGNILGASKYTLWPFFMDEVQLSQGYRTTTRGRLVFTIKSPWGPGTHLIDFGRVKSWVELRATQWFWTRDPGQGIQPLGASFSDVCLFCLNERNMNL